MKIRIEGADLDTFKSYVSNAMAGDYGQITAVDIDVVEYAADDTRVTLSVNDLTTPMMGREVKPTCPTCGQERT